MKHKNSKHISQALPKLALYLPSLRGGGAERVMVTLANAIAERGYAIDLVLAEAVGAYHAEVSSTVRIIDLKSSRVVSSLPGLIRYLRSERPVAILSAMGHANVVAVLAQKLAGVKTRVVVSERNTYSIASAHAQGWRSFCVKKLQRPAYLASDGIVAVSCGVADDLAKCLSIPRARIDVAYNPVVTESLLTLAQETMEQPWLTLGSSPLILGAGRLTKAKDFITLIRSFALVRATRPARLVIIGEGELKAELETEALKLGVHADVVLPGFIDNPFAVMRQADLFVLTSAWEGLPNVLIQAMACGIPVISTDCPSGPSEILEGGKWGRLVPVGDVSALSKAMIATLDEREHPDVAARAADFGVAQAVDKYLQVMLQCH
jgi:glycosyltransferase involved in cell wall biosynthesis